MESLPTKTLIIKRINAAKVALTPSFLTKETGIICWTAITRKISKTGLQLDKCVSYVVTRWLTPGEGVARTVVTDLRGVRYPFSI